jgi:hypothetical protein
MSSRAQAILIGGTFAGVLSALPIVSVANCCCVWLIGGGAITAYLLQQGQSEPVSLADASVGGCLAGVFGAFVSAVVSVPIQLVTQPLQRQMADLLRGNADVPPELAEMVEQLSGAGMGAALFGFVVMLVLGMVFSTLGGLFGGVVFRPSRPVANDTP